MKSALVAAVLLVLAPIAHAQDCKPLEAVIASAREADVFDSILGGQVDDGVFAAKVAFFDADECSIDLYVEQYYCLWARADAAEADAPILSLYDMAKVCLSGGWDWTDLAGKATGGATAITEGYAMTRTTGPSKGVVVRVYMDAKTGEASRNVWLEVE